MGDNGSKAISGMTGAEFEEFCKAHARDHTDILLPMVEQFQGRPIRLVAIWCLAFLVPIVRDLGKDDREWIAAALRKGADFMLEGQRN